jgi:hypothetical protein
MGVMNIAGKGSDALAAPTVTDFGSCPSVLPTSTAYGGNAALVPGTIQAERFDNGGEVSRLMKRHLSMCVMTFRALLPTRERSQASC